MDMLPRAAGVPLFWVQPRLVERRFELRSEKGVLGTLWFEKASGTLAAAESATGKWTFKRVGFLNPRVTIREAGAGHNVAVYWPRLWGDGWLEFASGARVHWKSANFWATAWGFAAERDGMLLVMKPGVEKPKISDLLKTQAVVAIEPQGHSHPEISLLVLFGWYLTILQQDDMGVTVAATTTAVG